MTLYMYMYTYMHMNVPDSGSISSPEVGYF